MAFYNTGQIISICIRQFPPDDLNGEKAVEDFTVFKLFKVC